MLPHAVVDTDLVRVESEIAWTRDDAYDAVTISGRDGAFEDDDRYEHLGDSRIGDDPVLVVPDRMMELSGFEPGDPIHFATTNELGAAGSCLCLSADDADRLLEDARAMSGSVDSGRAMDGP